MDCLLELCFAASIYVTGAVGIQPNQLGGVGESNQYGYNVGETSLIMEFNNGLYVGIKHISGLNTYESDGGYNAIMIGAKIYFKGN